MQNAEVVRNNLMSLNCFENINIHIDVSNGSNSTPNGYKVFSKQNKTFLHLSLKGIYI